MALIECPKCKGSISDKAEKCIHCGCPLEGLEEFDAESVEKPNGGEGLIAEDSESLSVEGMNEDDDQEDRAEEDLGPGSQVGADSEALPKTANLIKKGEIISKIKNSSRRFKAVAMAVIAVMAIVVAYVATTPSYIGKWYTGDSPESYFEIKRDGTVAVHDESKRETSSKVDMSWTELEKDVIIMDVKFFDGGSIDRDTMVMSYGKTNDGLEYLELADGSFLCKRYADAQKMTPTDFDDDFKGEGDRKSKYD